MDIEEKEVKLLVKMLIHDLEKPIAITSHILDRIDAGTFDIDNPLYKQIIKGTRFAMERSKRMIVDLNDILAQRVMPIKIQKFLMEDLIDQISLYFMPLSLSEDIKFTVKNRFKGEILTDFDLLYRIIANYLYNALNHTPVKGWIILETQTDSEGDIDICVSNSGPVINEKMLSKIFEPGVQLKLRQQQEWRGSGLGLAFCKMAAKSINMKVYAKNLKKNKGMAFHCHGNFKQSGEKKDELI